MEIVSYCLTMVFPVAVSVPVYQINVKRHVGRGGHTRIQCLSFTLRVPLKELHEFHQSGDKGLTMVKYLV